MTVVSAFDAVEPSTSTANESGSVVSLRALPGFFRRVEHPDETEMNPPRWFRNFELVPESWEHLKKQVVEAQIAPIPEGMMRQVKVLYFVRHGEGAHNAAVRAMGRAKWNAEGAFEEQYTDPHLTPAGVLDAQQKGPGAVQRELEKGMPAIQRCVTSPFCRAIETADNFFTPEQCPRPFIALESCRELLDTHVCNKRRGIAEIKAEFESIVDFSRVPVDDYDTFWERYDQRETISQQNDRVKTMLTEICHACPGETYVAVSCHRDIMQAMWLKYLKQCIPVVLNCEVFPIVVELLERK